MGDWRRSPTKTTGSTTVTFTWDTRGKVPMLLSDGTTDYVYGPTGTPIEQVTAGGANQTYYFADAHGSTVELTNQAGTVTGSYAYTPWGAVTSHSGTSTPVQFAGAYAESGLLYLQARYYDPPTAVFISVDALVSKTLAAYLYTSDDPLNRLDPLGLEDWWNPFSWDATTWGWVGVGIGAPALALTGVGIFADLSAGAALAVSASALTLGAAGEAIDITTCATSHDSVAYAGAVFNGATTLGGGAELAAGGALAGIDVGSYRIWSRRGRCGQDDKRGSKEAL